MIFKLHHRTLNLFIPHEFVNSNYFQKSTFLQYKDAHRCHNLAASFGILSPSSLKYRSSNTIAILRHNWQQATFWDFHSSTLPKFLLQQHDQCNWGHDVNKQPQQWNKQCSWTCNCMYTDNCTCIARAELEERKSRTLTSRVERTFVAGRHFFSFPSSSVLHSFVFVCSSFYKWVLYLRILPIFLNEASTHTFEDPSNKDTEKCFSSDIVLTNALLNSPLNHQTYFYTVRKGWLKFTW